MNRINVRDLTGALDFICRSGLAMEVGIKAGRGELVVSAASMAERIQYRISAEFVEGFNANVEAKGFRDLLRSFPVGAMLEVSLVANKLCLKQLNGTVLERSMETMDWQSGRHVFPEASEYKAAPGILDCIRDASFAAGKADVRKVFNGVLIEPGAIVATNGRELIHQEFKTGADAQYVLPVTKTLKSSLFANDTLIAYSRNDESGFCHFKSGRINYSVRCINGKFPQYRQVIPIEDVSWNKAVITDALLVQRLRALELAYGKQHNAELTVCFKSDRLLVKSSVANLPDIAVTADISAKAETSITLKAGQLIYALKHGYVGLSCSDNSSCPGLFADGKGRKFVFMTLSNAKKEVSMEKINTESLKNESDAQAFKVIPAEPKAQDFFDELTVSLEELRQHFRLGLECLGQLSRKVRDGKFAQKQREKEFKDTRDLIEKLKKASGF